MDEFPKWNTSRTKASFNFFLQPRAALTLRKLYQTDLVTRCSVLC